MKIVLKINLGLKWGVNQLIKNYIVGEQEILEKNYINHHSLEEYLQNIDFDYKYDPFVVINNFIVSDIIPRYSNLVECNLFKEDEYGDPAYDFYIRIIGDLSFSEEKQLRKKIYGEIRKYAEDLDYFDEFNKISIFLIR